MAVRLYAVLRRRPRTGTSLPPGLQGERLRLLKCGGCSAVVGEVVAALEPAVDILLEFDAVIRALANISDAILPARFGSLSPTVTTVKSEIAERADELSAALDHVTGCVQMTIRIPARRKGPAPGSPGPSRPGIAGAGASYLRARAAASSPGVLMAMRKALGDLVREERIDVGAAGTSVYHLVERSDVEAYRARLEGIPLAGPFPPYAFAPGIDHAIWQEHDEKANRPSGKRSTRPRPHRRSARNTHR